MADDGSTKNYKFGPKNQWRRTMANEIMRRTNGRERNEFGIYTAGPQDNDRDLLVSKGFPRRNLIGVDLSQRNIDEFRDRANYGVRGDLRNVLGSWPVDKPVCAIWMDLCCGLEPWIIGMLGTLANPALRSAIVVVNMMRGRDASSNSARRYLAAYGSIDKHRGKQLVAFMATYIAHGDPEFERLSRTERIAKMVRIENDHLPRFYSYQSGHLTFDSVVFQPITRFLNSPTLPAEVKEEAERTHRRHFRDDVRRRISAQFAMRTMQKRGSFPAKAKA